MAWLILILGGVCEVAWAISLKYSEGFSRLSPSILAVAAMAASMGCLTFATKSLPIGSAYAVWTGIGGAGTAVLGIYLFSEPVALPRLVFIGLIFLGVIGLRTTS